MEETKFIQKVNELLTDKDILSLESMKSKSNLFETLGVSHLELWHTAFIKWILDPKSSLNLYTFPLQRFLYAVIYHGNVIEEELGGLTLTIGDIETIDLENMIFQNEFTTNGLNRKRIDLIGIDEKESQLRIIIENKVKSQENNDQTLSYYDFFKDTSDDFEHDLYIFITPDERQFPKSNKFIQLTYQDLCDHVLKPCLEHPKISIEGKYLIKEYLDNLGKPLKGGRVMAYPNKEICEKIYKAHKEVLDEIFLSVKGEIPQRTKEDVIRSSNTTLTQLYNNNYLGEGYSLYKKYYDEEYEAQLVENNGGINVQIDNQLHNSPTAAAEAITNTRVNGWKFWRVRDNNGLDKGLLDDIRNQFANKNND